MSQLISTRDGFEIDAIDLRCDCGARGCEVTIRVPATIVEPPAGKRPYTAKKRAIVVHNLVQGRRIFGYPTV